MTKPVATWFKMKAENGVGKISILGSIGGFGVNFESFNRALTNLGPVNEIHLAINSDGGEVNDGFAIYNALAMHPATKTVTVMGLAASMASVVAMAGNKRVMPKNAVMMIHDPVGMIAGNAEEIQSYGEFVGDMRDKIAQTYADASGGKTSKNKFLALMDKQSWLGADQCMNLGLCTEVTEPQKMAAHYIRNVTAPKWECGASRDLAIDDTSSWNGPAAAESMLNDAGIGGTSPNVAKAKRGFLAVDSANPNLKGSYKLPFAILSGGTLKASTAGIRAAASRLPQTDIPQSVKDTARGVLDSYESKAKPKGKTMKPNLTEADFEGHDEATATAVAEAKTTAKAEILAQQKDVNALCRLAGKPEMAAKFNEDGKTVAEVMATLDTLPKKTGAQRTAGQIRDDEISARAAIDIGDEGVNADLDTAKIYANYNRKPGVARIQ